MSTTKIGVPGDVLVANTTDTTGETIARAGVRLMTPTTGPLVLSNTGDPNAAISAPAGSLYARTDVAQLWQNTSLPSPGTTWTQIVGGGLTFSGVSAYSTVNNDIVFDPPTWIVLQFANITYDTDNYQRIGSTSRFYAPADGYYRVVAKVKVEMGGSDALELALGKNQGGMLTTPFERICIRSGYGDQSPSTETVVRLNADDYVEVFYWFYNYSYLKMTSSQPFTMERIG